MRGLSCSVSDAMGKLPVLARIYCRGCIRGILQSGRWNMVLAERQTVPVPGLPRRFATLLRAQGPAPRYPGDDVRQLSGLRGRFYSVEPPGDADVGAGLVPSAVLLARPGAAARNPGDFQHHQYRDRDHRGLLHLQSGFGSPGGLRDPLHTTPRFRNLRLLSPEYSVDRGCSRIDGTSQRI